MSEQPRKIEHEAIPQGAQGVYHDEGLITEVLLYYDDEALYFEHIALCSDIGPMLFPTFSHGHVGRSRARALCLKQTSQGWSNFIDYRFRGRESAIVRFSFEMLKTLKEVVEDEHGDSPE